MQMVSDEILDFWFLIIGIVVSVVVIIIAIWILDRSRRHTPAYALGSAMQDAWAALQAQRIRTGQAAPMPTTVQGLEQVAAKSIQTDGFDPIKIEEQKQAEEKLAAQAEELAKKKAQLDQQTTP